MIMIVFTEILIFCMFEWREQFTYSPRPATRHRPGRDAGRSNAGPTSVQQHRWQANAGPTPGLSIHCAVGQKWSTLSIKSLCSSDTIRQQGTGSILAQVMACCLRAQSHCIHQCWFISNVHWDSPERFTKIYLSSNLAGNLKFYSNISGVKLLTASEQIAKSRGLNTKQITLRTCNLNLSWEKWGFCLIET